MGNSVFTDTADKSTSFSDTTKPLLSINALLALFRLYTFANLSPDNNIVWMTSNSVTNSFVDDIKLSLLSLSTMVVDPSFCGVVSVICWVDTSNTRSVTIVPSVVL